MLFHADKTIKESLFNMYKKDLIDRQVKKEEEISKEKLQDKNFMEEVVRLNEEERHKKSTEKKRIASENMNSYNELWRGKDEERKNRYYKVFDPKINYPALNDEIINQNKPFLARNRSYDFNSKIQFESQRDHVNNILQPDYLGVKNLQDLEKNQKQEYHKIYKNCLDSQINTRVNIYDLNNLKAKEYYAMKNKEQEVFVKKNPYSSKSYEIGNTKLDYNTITNPGPNLAYNKYLLIPQNNNKINSNTPESLRNSVPNLNALNSYSYPQNTNNNPFNNYSPEKNYDYANENRNYMNENIQNNYQNYMQGPQNYNGYNTQVKDRLRMAGNNIMK